MESQFPNTVVVSSVEEVDLEMVKGWAQKFTQVALVLVGGGPPCQGVQWFERSPKRGFAG